MATSWSICLVSGGDRKVVKVNPTSDTVGDLFRIAGEAYGVPLIESLKSGFPPLPLDINDSTPLSEAKNVGNQERIHVVLGNIPTEAKKKLASGKGGITKKDYKSIAAAASSSEEAFVPENQEDTGQSQPTRRSKRAAAQVATESFADVIRQQDKMMKEEKQAPSKKAKQGGTGKPKGGTKPKGPAFTSREPGRRLGDGAVIGSDKSKVKAATTKSSASSPRKHKAQRPELPVDQQKHEDMSTALLATLNQSGNGGRLLRKTMKSAVESSYESTKAAARLAALESRSPLEAIQMERIDGAKLRVKFQKVKGHGRGFYEEVVDWIPTDVLAEVLKAILKSNEENLLPENLAQLSPRFLWALAYRHWEEQQQKQMDQDSPSPWEPFSVEEAYRRLVPDRKDWSFLRHRKRILSEKAKENLRQQQETESDGEDYERAAEAVQDVERAMDHLQQYDRAQKAERIANAALTRQRRQQQSSAGEDKWMVVTPSEYDEDELIECIQASETPLKNPEDATEIANLLAKLGAAHNWRELANHAAMTLCALIVENDDKFGYITEEQVLQWVDHARLQSLEEIMVEICDGSTSHVQTLRDKSPVNTPKDLANWVAMPDLLLEELGDSTSIGLTEADLARFCCRATRALDQMEWLTWYVTPIE